MLPGLEFRMMLLGLNARVKGPKGVRVKLVNGNISVVFERFIAHLSRILG